MFVITMKKMNYLSVRYACHKLLFLEKSFRLGLPSCSQPLFFFRTRVNATKSKIKIISSVLNILIKFKLIFIWNVQYLASFWKRGFLVFGNSLEPWRSANWSDVLGHWILHYARIRNIVNIFDWWLRNINEFQCEILWIFIYANEYGKSKTKRTDNLLKY